MSKARLLQNVLVTVPGDGNQPGIVRSIDLDGGLLVELGSFTADQEVNLSSGRTKALVRSTELSYAKACTWLCFGICSKDTGCTPQ